MLSPPESPRFDPRQFISLASQPLPQASTAAATGERGDAPPSGVTPEIVEALRRRGLELIPDAGPTTAPT